MSTTATQNLAGKWADEIALLERPDGPDWLTALRDEAVESFTAHGLPHRKVEAWKYTPLKRLESSAPALTVKAEKAAPAWSEEPLLPDATTCIDIIDGFPTAEISGLPQGVTVTPFSGALDRFEERIRGLAGRVDVAGPGRAFAALNTAFIHQGLVVHVAAGIDAGSLLLRWACSRADGSQFTPFRLFVLLDEGAKLELVEQHSGGGALNLLVQAELATGSTMTHVRVQNQPEEAVLLTATLAQQAGDSLYRYRGFDLGGGLVRHELNTELAGTGAHADLAGACVLDGTRHGDNHVGVDHGARDCSSEQFFRCVLGGRSRGVFNGRALIREGADGSSVTQSNANLLLSRLAEMDTKPELEIYADEVEASHGATVGQLDESAVFYLRSRGLSEAEARRLLTAAFCHAVTSRLENEVLAEKIGEMIDAAMPEAT
jgi:Fe-S cluster assembly protein SufD